MRTAAASLPAASSAPRAAAAPAMRFATQENDIELKVDLSDLTLPDVNNLHVDGLKTSWWSRLFGK